MSYCNKLLYDIKEHIQKENIYRQKGIGKYFLVTKALIREVLKKIEFSTKRGGEEVSRGGSFSTKNKEEEKTWP